MGSLERCFCLPHEAACYYRLQLCESYLCQLCLRPPRYALSYQHLPDYTLLTHSVDWSALTIRLLGKHNKNAPAKLLLIPSARLAEDPERPANPLKECARRHSTRDLGKRSTPCRRKLNFGGIRRNEALFAAAGNSRPRWPSQGMKIAAANSKASDITGLWLLGGVFRLRTRHVKPPKHGSSRN
jgi:hypothetical protein